VKITSRMVGGSANDVVDSADTIAADIGGAPELLLAFASTSQPLGEVLSGLKKRFPTTTVLGCSTAGEITEGGDAKGHTALFALRGDVKVFAGMGTSLKENPEAAVNAAASASPHAVEGHPHRTAVILLDALAGVSEETTLLAAVALGGEDGSEVRLVGGAAGDDLKMAAPLVGLGGADGSECANNAVVILTIFSKVALGVGVCHGHRTISQPLTITKSEGATVFEVNGRPAWDVWREETAAAAKAAGIDTDALAGDDVGAYLLRFEAGLETGGAIKIRAPLGLGADGSLSFACGIPQGSVVRITESGGLEQITSAVEAARRAREQMGGGDVAGALIFDCICRNLILKSDFSVAVRGMNEALGGAPMAGFESYGEVALDAGDFSGFHNTTTVVLAFPKTAEP